MTDTTSSHIDIVIKEFLLCHSKELATRNLNCTKRFLPLVEMTDTLKNAV